MNMSCLHKGQTELQLHLNTESVLTESIDQYKLYGKHACKHGDTTGIAPTKNVQQDRLAVT